MPTRRAFSRPLLALLDASKILGIRAGDDHKYLGIWIVVVKGRVFVTPWNDKPTGWREAFRHDAHGAMTVGDREVRVRARPVRGERLLDEIMQGYAAKYPTPGSKKWVDGFNTPKRRATTIELLPR